jgi:galactokinase
LEFLESQKFLWMRVKFAILSAAAAATGISLYFLYKRFSSSSRRRDPALNEAIDLFISTYLHKPTHAASAPGRVNLIGEHTDYNDGFVMPCALELRTFIVGSVNHQQRVIRIVSSNMKDNVVEIPLEDLEKKSEEKNWWDYIRGVLAIYQAKSKAKIPGLNLAIVGKVPLGSGLSSSAAVEVATATFLEGLFGLDSSKEEIALIAQKAEHEYAGCPCGIMDQFISAMGKQGNALLLDCRTRIPKYIPLSNPDFVVLVTSMFN